MAAAILIALAVLVTVDAGLTARHLLKGRDYLLAAAKSLQASGPTLTNAQASLAMANLRRANSEFTSARGSLYDPFFRFAGFLPLIGHQVKATRSLADMGVQASSAGELAIQVVDSLLSEHEVGPGSENKAPGERLLSLLKASDPKLNTIGATLTRLQADRASIPTSGLLPPISNAVKQFDAKFASLPAGYRTFRAIEPGLYALLGSSGPRSYLVIQEDPAELRAAGGFIGSVGFLAFDHGKMPPYQPHDIYEIDGTGAGVRLGVIGGPKYVAPPAPLDRFIHPSSWELRDSNWWPDFPTSALEAETLYQRETGSQVSGVISIDPFLVANLLGLIGPVKVPETGDTVTAQNFFLKTIERVQLHQGAGSQKSFLSYAGKPILDRLFALPSRDWEPIFSLFSKACETRSLQAYFDDPATEAMVRQFRCDGRIQAARGDELLVVDSNLDGNKDDYWVKRSFNLQVTVNKDGSARHTLRLHYSGYPQIPNITGPYIGWLRIYLPPSANLIRSDGASLRMQSELGHSVAAGWIEWRFDSTKDVTVVYDVDAATMHMSGQRLDLYWQKQAGREADPITVKLQLPKNWKRVTATVGSTLATGTTIETDLRVDREFRFLIEQG